MSNLKIVPASAEMEALSQAVLSYKEIKAKIAFLENELKTHKETIEQAASQTQDGKIITENFKVSLSVFEVKNFDKAGAMATLGDKLTPFFSVGLQKRLVVS